MTRFLLLVSFLLVCLFGNLSGAAFAGAADDGLSLKNFKLADAKPYDALAKAFQKTHHHAVSSSSTKTSHKKAKATSKLSKKSKSYKKAKAFKSRSSKSHKKSYTKKSKNYKKAAYRH
ncbi:MAG: hypothetical protein ACP5U1_11630 [Desulfomonilaceae bacterium]